MVLTGDEGLGLGNLKVTLSLPQATAECIGVELIVLLPLILSICAMI